MIVRCGACGWRFQSSGYDMPCLKCGAELNAFGQVLAYPNGQGEDYAGEVLDADDEIDVIQDWADAMEEVHGE